MKHTAKIVAMVQLPPPMHGAAAMNRHAVDALRTRFDTHVIDMRFNDRLSGIARISPRKILQAVWLTARLCSALRGADAFYICFAPTGAAFYRDSFYVLIARLFGIPSVMHLHGRGLATLRRNGFARWLQPRVFKGQTAIILGRALQPELDALACRTAIIANCLPDDAFASPGQPPRTPPAPIRLLYLSNLFRAKGIDTLLAACHRLKQQGMDFHLDIAGADGDMTGQQLDERLIQHDLGDVTTCHGAVDAAGRAKLFQAADLFVFPSHYPNEAQPLVVLEAMAAGVPVIASNIATLPDIIRDGETGRLCIAQDPENLARIMTDMLNTPERSRAMTEAARRLCRSDFTKARFARDLTRLIAGIVA